MSVKTEEKMLLMTRLHTEGYSRLFSPKIWLQGHQNKHVKQTLYKFLQKQKKPEKCNFGQFQIQIGHNGKIDNSKDDTKEIGMVNVYSKILVKFHARNFIKIFRVDIYFDLVKKRTGI